MPAGVNCDGSGAVSVGCAIGRDSNCISLLENSLTGSREATDGAKLSFFSNALKIERRRAESGSAVFAVMAGGCRGRQLYFLWFHLIYFLSLCCIGFPWCEECQST